MTLEIAVAALFTCALAQAESSPEKAGLAAILRARAEQIQTFQAEVRLDITGGTDRAAANEARLAYAAWVEKNHPELAKEVKPYRENLGQSAEFKLKSSRARYIADAAGRIRVERLPVDPQTPNGSSVSILTFTGEDWNSYREGDDRKTGERVGTLNIHQDERRNQNWVEVARGAGIAADPLFAFDLHLQLSRRAVASKTVDWNEVFQLFPPEQCHEETSTPPGGSGPLPSLRIEPPPFKETGLGVHRIQIWFSPEQGYAPVALVASDLQPAGGGKWHLLPNHVVAWSDPAEFEGGLTLFRKCLIRFYNSVPEVTDGTPRKEWRRQAYEMMRYDYTFSNVQVNESLDAKQFEVQPVAGTNVVDESKGYLYVVGNAGEELQKTALSERARRPQIEAQAKKETRWRMVLLVANLVLLAAIAAYWFVFRKA